MTVARVENKIALVTGAGSGIGRAVAQMLAREGAKVIATDIDQDSAEQTAQAINNDGGHAVSKVLDISDEAQWQTVFDFIVKEYQDLDILVNNAGISVPCPIMELSLEEFRRTNDINVHGTFIGCKGAIATMRLCAEKGAQNKQQEAAIASGSIINIASITGQVALMNFPAYSTSKAAVTNMCKALGVEMGEAGTHIRVNSVHPGAVKTKLTVDMYGEDFFDEPSNFNFIPSKTYSDVDDIAYAVLYLASDESRLVTGTELTVDGGTTTGIGGFE